MASEEIKNSNQEISEDTHIRTVELESILGVTSSTYYKDISYLGIQIYKDSHKCGWILKSDLSRIKLLRKYVRLKGTRGGFNQLESGYLVTGRNKKFTGKSNPGNAKINNQEKVFVSEEASPDNLDLDEMVREGAQLKAREIVLRYLIVRSIADKLEEHELPEDLQEKISDARRASNPQLIAEDMADLILKSYRQNLA